MTTKNRHKKNSKDNIPEPTIKRLPVYLAYAHKLKRNSIENISAPVMASFLDRDPTQIVKDLAVTGVKGKPKVGYEVDGIIKAIEEYLGFNKKNEAFLIGTGKLGQAILSYHELQGYGIKIITAFDVDDSIVGLKYAGVPILHLDKLGELAKRLEVEIGILTVPATAAQHTAEAMVKSGIKAIWNLTPCNLDLPDSVIVQNTSMYSNVAVLLRKYHNK